MAVHLPEPKIAELRGGRGVLHADDDGGSDESRELYLREHTVE